MSAPLSRFSLRRSRVRSFGRARSKPRSDVFLRALVAQAIGSRSAPDIEVAIRMRLGVVPLEKHRFGASLARDEAHGLALNDLHPGIDTGTGAIAEAIPNDLDQVAHELVIVLKTVVLDPQDGPVVGHADEQVATLGVEEGGDRLEHGVGDVLVVLAVFLQVPAQAGLELERLRLLELEQVLCSPVAPDVVVEEEVLDRLTEGRIVGDPLV